MTKRYYLIRHVYTKVADAVVKCDDQNLRALSVSSIHNELGELIDNGGTTSDYAVVALPLDEAYDDHGERILRPSNERMFVIATPSSGEPLDRLGAYATVRQEDVNEAIFGTYDGVDNISDA